MNLLHRMTRAASLCAALLFTACYTAPGPQSAHSQWSYRSVVYEMNVRQQSREGNFAAAEKRLPFLKELGVDIIWLMPIHPIGVKERKGTLGSYYAIRDYRAINPEFGTMEDFERFLKSAHKLNLKVIMDCVANHTSPDAAWVTEKPAEWYHRDSTGKPIVQYDWTDISKLNYDCREVREAMIDQLEFWTAKGVDGFRCDAAAEMPDEFWQEAIRAIKALNPEAYMLAEGEGTHFHRDGFDATYAWELHHLMNDIAQGEKTVDSLRTLLAKSAGEYPETAFRLMFTSNHDENSWAGTEFERMGDAAACMASLTYLLPQGQPLIYTGQEVGFNRRLQFFEKDSIDDWTPNHWTEFYRKLNDLRHRHPALQAGEAGGKMVEIANNNPSRLLSFVREAEGRRVMVLMNLSPEIVEARFETRAHAGEYTDALNGGKERIGGQLLKEMLPWHYQILYF